MAMMTIIAIKRDATKNASLSLAAYTTRKEGDDQTKPRGRGMDQTPLLSLGGPCDTQGVRLSEFRIEHATSRQII